MMKANDNNALPIDDFFARKIFFSHDLLITYI